MVCDLEASVDPGTILGLLSTRLKLVSFFTDELMGGMGHDERVLVVDLDGTLIRSDMLFENFWTSCSKTWTAPLQALMGLASGRAALKRRLCIIARVQVSVLPYNADVLTYIQHWRSTGGRTSLVTASDQMHADAIAAHLGIFDEAHGSDGVRNLKGEAKAKFLSDRFGEGRFDYMGNAAADLPIWAQASKAITINLSQRLRAKVDSLAQDTEHLTNSAPGIGPYIKTLRPHQWLKNILVFLPMIAPHTFSPDVIGRSGLAFVAFCLVASSGYVVNDLLNLTADRVHPRKRLRPLASGDLPIAHGTFLSVALLALGLICAVPLGWLPLLLIAGYFVASLAYSLDLKRRMIVDIFMLAVLYTTGIIVGGAATGMWR